MSEEKLYTIEAANAMLPWVIEQLGSAAEAADRLFEARSDQAELEGISRSNGHGDIDSRLSDVRADASSALDALRGVLEKFSIRVNRFSGVMLVSISGIGRVFEIYHHRMVSVTGFLKEWIRIRPTNHLCLFVPCMSHN